MGNNRPNNGNGNGNQIQARNLGENVQVNGQNQVPINENVPLGVHPPVPHYVPYVPLGQQALQALMAQKKNAFGNNLGYPQPLLD